MSEPGNELVQPFRVPATGQIVDLDNPYQVAQILWELGELQEQIKYAKRELVEALEPIRAQQGKSTIELGDFEVALTSSWKTEYDMELLAQKLIDAGLPEERLTELIVPTVSYKLNLSVARQLRAANPDYAAALDQAETRVPATVYAKVRRGR